MTSTPPDGFPPPRPQGFPTSPYAAQPAGPPPRPQPEPHGGRKSGRAAFAAGVITASLVLGGVAGTAGAVAWSEWNDDGSDTANTSTVQDADNAGVSAAPAPDGSVQQVAETVLPSVVKINVVGPEGAGSGSGIILSADGEILTNNHVVDVATQDGSISVSFDDGSSAPATILGTDPLTDTAVLKAEDVSGLTPASIGQSGRLAVGQEVVAIGSPFGLDATVTSGIVSALDRPVNAGSDAAGNSTTYPAIQTDAAINPGNSGGPLADMNGDVVGINSSIRTARSSTPEAAGSIGLGFAIPIDEVMPIVEQMTNGETPTHARLGVSVSDVETPQGQASAAIGAQVQQVSPDTTAAEAGLEEGDVITKIDDRLITGADSLVATIRSYRPGDTVTVTYLRGEDEQTTEVALGSDAEADNS